MTTGNRVKDLKKIKNIKKETRSKVCQSGKGKKDMQSFGTRGNHCEETRKDETLETQAVFHGLTSLPK